MPARYYLDITGNKVYNNYKCNEEGLHMKPDTHRLKIQEAKEELEDSILTGYAKRQVTIGFYTSFLACNMFELYLHNARLVDLSTNFKHEWFASKRKLQERFTFDFPRKQEILELMHLIEKNRNVLCYGNPQPELCIKEQVERLHALEIIFQELSPNGS